MADGRFFTGFIIFDHQGIHHFRRARLCQVAHFKCDPKDPKYVKIRKIAIWKAEARALRDAICHVINQNCFPTKIETKTFPVNKAIKGEWCANEDEVDLEKVFREIINECLQLIGNKSIQVKWVPRQLNRVADNLVSIASRLTDDNDCCRLKKGLIDLEPTITDITWEAIYGASHVIVREEKKNAKHKIKRWNM